MHTNNQPPKPGDKPLGTAENAKEVGSGVAGNADCFVARFRLVVVCFLFEEHKREGKVQAGWDGEW